MREDFVKETKIYDKTEQEKEFDLYEEIENSKKRLNSFYENMNFASGDLIDYYVYQIKAEQAKFGFLINEVKMKMKMEK